LGNWGRCCKRAETGFVKGRTNSGKNNLDKKRNTLKEEETTTTGKRQQRGEKTHQSYTQVGREECSKPGNEKHQEKEVRDRGGFENCLLPDTKNKGDGSQGNDSQGKKNHKVGEGRIGKTLTGIEFAKKKNPPKSSKEQKRE